MTPDKFPQTPPEAFIPLIFDFSKFAGAGVSIATIKSLAVVAKMGIDTTPATRFYNAAAIEGTQSVVQWWRYPAQGEIYDITCTVTFNDTREWSKTGRLVCLPV